MQRLEITIRNEVTVIEHQLARNGVTVIKGWGSFVDTNTIEVATPEGDTFKYKADRIIIAVGTSPLRPKNIPFDDETIIDSDGILKLKKIPRSLTIVGAGVIGVEYASIFSAMDVHVNIIDGRPNMLEFLDREIVDELAYGLRHRAVTLRLGETVAEIKKSNGEVEVKLESGKVIKSNLVMYAAGRTGCTEGLKLENAGLSADNRGRIKVDENYATEVPHIYAVGDVIGFPSLASTSMEQGRVAACHAFDKPVAAVPNHFPFGIYSIPEISMVGATEQELTAANIPYEVGIARFRETARGQILRLDDGLLKLLFGLKDRKLLGVHIIGEAGTELVHIGQAVLVMGGTLEYFVNTVFNYPTLAETYKIAALDAYNKMPIE
jgi:NAD(P) transhydrogenase